MHDIYLDLGKFPKGFPQVMLLIYVFIDIHVYKTLVNIFIYCVMLLFINHIGRFSYIYIIFKPHFFMKNAMTLLTGFIH